MGPPRTKPSKTNQIGTKLWKKSWVWSTFATKPQTQKRATKQTIKTRTKTQKHTNTTQPTIQNKTCTTTSKPKVLLWHLEQQPTILGKCSMFSCNLHLFFCNCCALLKSFQSSVFSQHSSCVSQIVTPLFYTHSNRPFWNGWCLFWKSSKFTVYLFLTENPLLLRTIENS